MRQAFALAVGAVAALAANGCLRAPSTTAGAGAASVASVVHDDVAAFAAGSARAGAVVLDVRTAGEVARAHLAGASVVDLRDPRFAEKVGRMARERPVYVYCASGGRSATAAEQLVGMGFTEVHNLRGGIRAWQAEGRPVAQGDVGDATGPGVTVAAFDAARAAAGALLVSYETPWCAPCQRMKPRLDEASAALGLRLLRVDVDASAALADRERVVGVPVLVLYRDGREALRHSGELDSDALLAALRQASAAPKR